MDAERIKRMRTIPLLNVAEMYGFSFRPVGDKMRGLCLFHGDTNTPNFFIYPEGNFFCFSCRKGGDKAEFVAQAEKTTWRQVMALWEKGTDIRESVDLRLTDKKTNYRDALLLLVAKVWYNKLHDGSLDFESFKQIDQEISAKPFIGIGDYNFLVSKLR